MTQKTNNAQQIQDFKKNAEAEIAKNFFELTLHFLNSAEDLIKAEIPVAENTAEIINLYCEQIIKRRIQLEKLEQWKKEKLLFPN